MLRLDSIKLGSLIVAILVLTASFGYAQIATGGSYALEQAAIANGGGNSAGGFFAVEGTSGQSLSGTNGTGGVYSARGGFWNPMLGPTAANVSISGQVLRVDGAGIRNVFLTLTGGRLTTPKISRSSALGYFSFDDVEVGQTYVVTVSSKRFGFAMPSQTVSVTDSIFDLIFTSSWEN